MSGCIAVLEELSDENMLEPRVAEDTEESTLIWSNELRWLDEVSFVDVELKVP